MGRTYSVTLQLSVLRLSMRMIPVSSRNSFGLLSQSTTTLRWQLVQEAVAVDPNAVTFDRGRLERRYAVSQTRRYLGYLNEVDTPLMLFIDVREIQCKGATCCAHSSKAFAMSESNTIFCGYQ